MNVLVLNAGSSTLRFQLVRTDAKAMFGGQEGRISTDASRVEVRVVPTDEELLIARDTVRVVPGLESRY